MSVVCIQKKESIEKEWNLTGDNAICLEFVNKNTAHISNALSSAVTTP